MARRGLPACFFFSCLFLYFLVGSQAQTSSADVDARSDSLLN